jgi:hypothetical protein
MNEMNYPETYTAPGLLDRVAAAEAYLREPFLSEFLKPELPEARTLLRHGEENLVAEFDVRAARKLERAPPPIDGFLSLNSEVER